MTHTIKTVVNGGLTIEEPKNGIRFGTDALLLADFVCAFKNAVELGSGSGIVSLLLLSQFENAKVTAVEFNEDSAELSLKNAGVNGLGDRYRCVTADVLDTPSHLPCGGFDCVFTNPPYLKNNCGLKNTDPGKFAAFHETTAGIDEFAASASYLLKYGGRFFVVYRPEYLSKLFRAMEKYDIRPKKLRMIYPSYDKPPCLVLVEGKKGGKDGMITEPPFFIYSDSSHQTFSLGMKNIYSRFS